MMRRQIIQYKLKPESVKEFENRVLLFLRDMKILSPENMSYEIIKLEDGQSFVHFYTAPPGQGNPAFRLPSFRALQLFIQEHSIIPPTCMAMNAVGCYDSLHQ